MKLYVCVISIGDVYAPVAYVYRLDVSPASISSFRGQSGIALREYLDNSSCQLLGDTFRC